MTHRDVLVMGETLIDFLPDSSGSLSTVESFERRAGGAPANVAVALSRLGVDPWFWTRVGEDPFGQFLADVLDAEGVTDRFVERDPAAKTSLAFVSHDEAADRAFTFYRHETADTRFEPGAVPDDVLDAVSWVHVGGLTLADEPARMATLDLVERARDRDCLVSFDPNARPELWSSREAFADAVAELLPLADVVKATPEDLREAGLTGTPSALAEAVCERGPHTALLTLGRDGALARATADAPWAAGTVTHPGYAATAVDTTGAGDAFTAGVVAALAAGETSLDSALGFANAVAALTTTAPGAMTALPDRTAVREFRARQTE